LTSQLTPTADKTQELLDVLRTGKRLVVLTHNNPDPDSMASAMGMGHLAMEVCGIPSICAIRGDIFRAENRVMVKKLGYDLKQAADEPFYATDVIAVVDTQPGFGHTVIPEGKRVDIVVDHHVGPMEGEFEEPRFRDVRTEIGATSSIITEYLMEAGVEVPSRIATGLFYGIRTDTADLGRNASPLDEKAYMFLLQRIDRKAISEITQPQVPVDYFRALRKAMNTTRIYGNVVLCSLGRLENPEMVAEVADLLIRLEGKQWVIVGGLHQDTYYVSVRTDGNGKDAWLVLRDAMKNEGSFGGHGSVAGGRVQLVNPNPRSLGRLERRLQKSILETLGAAHLPAGTLA
jgi:nanoRNase/pAp phosphatase (c-di-AMP/oligoRNAs hydrolase)